MTAWQWGLMHALVDAASAATATAHSRSPLLSEDAVWWLILVYNGLAFGLQPLVGLVVDAARVANRAGGRAADGWDRCIAIGGLLLVGLAAVSGSWPWLAAVAAAGLGNALFHVGAGAIVLAGHPGRATEPGVFVAPGALGLAAGLQLGGMGFPLRWLMVAAIACAVAWLMWCFPSRPGRRELPPRLPGPLWLMAGAVLLLLAVSLRGWLGDGLAQGSREVATAAWLVAVAAFTGKLLGGPLADRGGWRLVAVSALLGLALWATVFPLDRLVAAVGGMALLQLTMPMTLAGLSCALPRWPGTAFGLTSWAFLVPSVMSALGWLDQDPVLLFVPATLVAAIAVGLGLTCVAANSRCWRC